jgi:Na+-translocating ferredoxin:NAD+ oxidoreductase RnfG subunit
MMLTYMILVIVTLITAILLYEIYLIIKSEIKKSQEPHP